MCSMNESDSTTELYYDYFTCDQETSSPFGDEPIVRLVIYYALFFLGLLGNWMVLWVLLRYTRLKSMTDVFLLNLVVSDILLAVSLPAWAYSSENLAACKLITGLYQLGFYSGTLFVTLMSVDRYLAIVHAVAAMRTRTLRLGIMASVIVWLISVIMATPQVVFASLEKEAEENLTIQCQPRYPEETLDAWKKQRNFSENTVGLFVCLPIMMFCYAKILFVLSKSRNSKKGKAMKLIFTVVCVFVICWVPYNVVVFLQTLELLEILNGCELFMALNSAMGIAEIIALCHCCVNPVIYAFMGEKFRKTLSNVLVKFLPWIHHSRVPFSSQTENETSNTPVRSDF
ncbi:C-C chemokine receptor type 4 [Nothobranchius furzeri]|uniref:C-C chemokine receptor type 4-like n=2 Tax=Nothobranchius furzeri TaxID=105023 RepID=A0A9D2YUH2_NOTFU|nr:C-C chemokine receptor type 4 [Nothobranchius furzeri]KAF7226098.1 C-C chemokine receptor type 4-like [Nothobranchius furzeri]